MSDIVIKAITTDKFAIMRDSLIPCGNILDHGWRDEKFLFWLHAHTDKKVREEIWQCTIFRDTDGKCILNVTQKNRNFCEDMELYESDDFAHIQDIAEHFIIQWYDTQDEEVAFGGHHLQVVGTTLR